MTAPRTRNRVTIEIDLDITDWDALEQHYRRLHLDRTGRHAAPTDGIVDALMLLFEWAACDTPGVTLSSMGGERPVFDGRVPA